MRHIPLKGLIKVIFADANGKKDKERLVRAHKTVKGRAKDKRQKYIDNNGSKKWSPLKNRMTAHLGNKCWYTETELVGADLTIDHYRPKSDYWWLAFDAENYRVACPYANSPKQNEAQGCAGGKGDSFPLLDEGKRARCKGQLKYERPVILDPCKKEDCELVAFQSDGRPILNPTYSGDPIAAKRVDESKVLLNLDHPDFNSKREQLFHDIAQDVQTYEELNEGAASRTAIRTQIKKRLAPNAPFSMAARYYLRLHRDLSWVEELLKDT